MEWDTDPTAQKLGRAFMQFRKAGWHPQSIAGCTLSEIGVLMCLKSHAKPSSQLSVVLAHEPQVQHQPGPLAVVHQSELPAMKVSEISKWLRVASPTITQLIKGLEANGLIERNIDLTDRRAVAITLTEKGERVAQQAEDAFFVSFHGLVEYLGEEESNQLAELLFKVSRYFDEQAASANYAQWAGAK
jgi:DNA-binding MarR family transcriptional regulator